WVVLRLADGAQAAPAGAAAERAIALTAAILRTASDLDIAAGLAVPFSRLLIPPRMGRFHLDRLLAELGLLDVDPANADPLSARSPGFPDLVARSGACIVVHAGAVDESFGPRHARHLSARELDRLVQPGTISERLIALLDATPPALPRRRWRRRAAPGDAA